MIFSYLWNDEGILRLIRFKGKQYVKSKNKFSYFPNDGRSHNLQTGVSFPNSKKAGGIVTKKGGIFVLMIVVQGIRAREQ